MPLFDFFPDAEVAQLLSDGPDPYPGRESTEEMYALLAAGAVMRTPLSPARSGEV